MPFKTKTSTMTLSSDVVFEPNSELKTEEGSETLILHIPDFKKDQLKVQVNNLGVLKVSGEKPLGEDGKRKSRFLKETKIPEGCDMNHIRAKFNAGQLHVIMPVKTPNPPENQQVEHTTPPLTALQTDVTQKAKEIGAAINEQKIKGLNAIKASTHSESQHEKPMTALQSDATQKAKEIGAALNEQRHKGLNAIKATTQKAEDLGAEFNERKRKASDAIMGRNTSKEEAKDDVYAIGNSIASLKVNKKVAVSVGVAVVAFAVGAYVAYTYASSSSPPSHIED